MGSGINRLYTVVIATSMCAVFVGCGATKTNDEEEKFGSTLQAVGYAPGYDLPAAPAEPAPGATVLASWRAPEGRSKTDWIGLYMAGTDAHAYLSWAYIGKKSISGATPLHVPADAADGTYEIRLYEANEYSVLAAQSPSFSINLAASFSLAEPPPTAVPGDALSVVFRAPTQHSVKDWVGLYSIGQPDTAYEAWSYVPDGSTGTVTVFVPPSAAGPHELRYYLHEGDRLATTSTSFDVLNPYSLSGGPVAISVGGQAWIDFNAPVDHGTADWIGLYPVGGADRHHESWVYVPVGANGSVRIPVPPTASGPHELRYYLNNGYERVATSAAFEVIGSPTLSLAKDTYLEYQLVTIHWAGCLTSGDWIGILPFGSDPSDLMAITNPYGSPEGDWGLRLQEGVYVAQYFDEAAHRAASSGPFQVVRSPTLNVLTAAYLLGNSVEVTWDSPIPFDGQLVVAATGSSDDSVVASTNLNGTPIGSYSFAKLDVGEYEARLLDPFGFRLATSAPFQVVPLFLTADRSEYALGTPVVISWQSGLQTGGSVKIAIVGSDPSQAVASLSVGAGAGSNSFEGLSKGEYEVRYFDETGQLVAVGATFSVYYPIAAEKTPYAPHDFLVVSWRHGPNSPGDWVAVAPSGSSDTTVTMKAYVDSSDGTHAFGPLPSGTYQARYFRQGTGPHLYESAVAVVQPPVPSSFIAASVGLEHACGITLDHKVRCWGLNLGQLGNAPFADTAEEVPGLTNAIQIDSGYMYACAVLEDGTARCWGQNSFGRLGDGEGGGSWGGIVPEPVQVNGLTNAIAIGTGQFHACALLRDGRVQCWGGNWRGQLGNGTTTDSLTPVDVVGVTNAVELSAGYGSNCVVTGNGTLLCWGSNDNGELANGTIDMSTVAVEAQGIADVASVSAEWPACALIRNGTIRCWGYNRFGELGNGTTTPSYLPVQVAGISDAIKLKSGWGAACALSRDGKTRCWGVNDYGQLGDLTTTNRTTPTEVSQAQGAVDISMGYWSTCSQQGNGKLQCWGKSSFGQLGEGATSNSNELTEFNDCAMISVGGGHVCASMLGGRVRCWGENSEGEIGDGTLGNVRTSPTEVMNVGRAAAVATGAHHTCARLEEGTVRCWGANDSGQLGNGTTSASAMPIAVTGVTNAMTVRLGMNHSCAVLATGGIRCWGANESGQLGDASTTNHSEPIDVVGITNAVAVGGGMAQSCALLGDGRIQCWGAGDKCQLGNDSYGYATTPVDVVGVSSAVALGIGSRHACALLDDGSIQCWGYNGWGQLGHDPTGANNCRPIDVEGLETAVAIEAAGDYTCALLQDKRVKCWGNNDYGQLGDGTHTARCRPVELGGVGDVIGMAAGALDLCVLHSANKLRCWGNNDYGQFGDGRHPFSTAAQTVVQIP